MNRPVTSCVNAQAKSRGGRVARRLAAVVCLAFSALICVDSYADMGVPLSLQVLLLSRLGTYDRHFKDRAGAVATVLVVHRKGNSESAFEGASLIKALAELHDIGGVPVNVQQAEFSDPESLAQRCRTEKIAVLYLTVGLEGDLPHLAAALVNADVLTVGTTARHAQNGAVVGFALEEARPKLVLNVRQAKAQNVDFKAEVLSLARLVE
jgi:hypothetical protein